MIFIEAIPELSVFIFRISILAVLLVALIAGILFLRRPIVRRSIRNAVPEGTSDVVIEQKVKKSQRRAGLWLWSCFFLLPMLALTAIIVANDMH